VAADRLRQAARLQRAAARQGFDWPAGDPRLWAKLAEEIGELRRARHDRRRAAEELGDLLFMAVNLARHLRVDPAAALAGANARFARRFAFVMSHAGTLPARGSPRRLAAMDALWRLAKRAERARARAKVPRHAAKRGSRHAHRTGR
jgi:uncharacterized protein YabN with tetrapyrrole methylase and pyrophosphatase domain